MKGRSKSNNRQYLKIIKSMLDGEAISPDALVAKLANSGLHMERLSTYLWNARKSGFDVVVIKTGRTVESYRLRDIEGATKKVAEFEAAAAAGAAAKVAKASAPKKAVGRPAGAKSAATAVPAASDLTGETGVAPVSVASVTGDADPAAPSFVAEAPKAPKVKKSVVAETPKADAPAQEVGAVA